MHTTRKIILPLFIFGASITTTKFCLATEIVENVQSTQASRETEPTNFDDFDSLAENMVDMGVIAEAPKPMSTIDRWVQQLCSPIIMKYVALKGYLRNWGYWMIGIKTAQNND